MVSLHAYNPIALLGVVLGVAVAPLAFLATLFALVRMSLGV